MTPLAKLLRSCAALLAFAVALPSAAAAPADRLAVVATIPDLGDLVEQIGGDRVEVTVLARSGQNLHGIRVKPSHLVATSRADVFVQIGLALEHAWVPGLLETARNRAIAFDQPGFVDAGAGYRAIQVPDRLDRSQAADVHPLGNPHVHLAVDGGPLLAERILAALVELDPDHAEEHRERHAAWLERYETALLRWTMLAERVAAAEAEQERAFFVCQYHSEFDYLLRFLGVDVAATVEPAPGLPPTPGHLREIDTVLREKRVQAVLTAPWSDNSTTRRVARSVDAEVVVLSAMLREDEADLDWIASIDQRLVRIAGVFGIAPPSDEEVAERARREARAAEAERAGQGDDASPPSAGRGGRARALAGG